VTPAARRLALTVHVTASVGCLGAVAAFLALAIAGLATDEARTAAAAYTAMEFIAWSVVLPLIVASLVSGLVQSLGTEWGVFRHYWVVLKLCINVLATVVLLLHMQPIGVMADAVGAATLAAGELRGIRIQLVANAGAALLVLLVATVLSIYKPRGLTPYGSRRTAGTTAATPRWVKLTGVLLAVLVALFAAVHLTGHGLGRHGSGSSFADSR
jgi:hypothetical protein